MNLLMNLANIINVLSASNGANTNGMVFIGIGLAATWRSGESHL